MIFLFFNPNVPLYYALAVLFTLIISITFHEFCHAITADKLGDSTPRYHGRITLNPAEHFDPIGFLVMLFLPFGWGKPVPVNARNFKNPRVGDAITTFMGPFSNLLLIAFAIITLKAIQAFVGFTNVSLPFNEIQTIFSVFVSTNLVLFIFNLLPIPPLDGYHVFGILLPLRIKESIDNFFAAQNFFITLIFIFFVGQLLSPVIQFAYNIGSRIISSLL